MRKKKFPLTALAIICGTIIGLLIIARLTGAISFYNTPTGANAPAIKTGSRFLSSNLLTPERFDFITFYYTDSLQGKHLRVSRLCGMPGDKLEIKNGDLYINEQSVDGPLNLLQLYRISNTSMITVGEHFELEEGYGPFQVDSGKAVIFLSKKQAKELETLKIPCERYPNYEKNTPQEIQDMYHQPWTVDNFGPVQVPANQYFVMGDNRYMSQDSRYIGFIRKKDIHGVVLNVK